MVSQKIPVMAPVCKKSLLPAKSTIIVTENIIANKMPQIPYDTDILYFFPAICHMYPTLVGFQRLNLSSLLVSCNTMIKEHLQIYN